MAFTEEYSQLSCAFNLKTDRITLPDIEIHNFSFKSTDCSYLYDSSNHQKKSIRSISLPADSYTIHDKKIRYTIFTKNKNKQQEYSKPILILLGLNEKKWDKYLCWAKTLVETTDKPVILFPISFQVNFTPLSWTGIKNKKLRKNNAPADTKYFTDTTVNRLDKISERFALSGFQSICDILRLVTNIKEGTHPLFKEGTTVDLFGYSIGAFIAQILLLANPKNLFEKSKFMLFCGGAFFHSLKGNSRYTISNSALKKMRQFYETEIKEKYVALKEYLDALSFENIELAFKSMLSSEKFKRYREKIFRQFSQQIHAITLVKDTYISPENVYNTLRGKEGLIPIAVNVLDFPYHYTHESPFPVYKNSPLKSTVDSCFNSTFTIVANFLRDK